MAFAISSGLPPQSGLYCAVVTGFLISLLGGSRTQIGGPTVATSKLELIRTQMNDLPEIVVLRLRNMTAIDGTGLEAFEDLAEQLKQSGRTMILCGAREQPAALIRRVDFAGKIGAKNICLTVDDALARAAELHSEKNA